MDASLAQKMDHSPKVTPVPASKPGAAMARLEQLRPLLEPILQSEDVPAGLAFLVVVESGGRPDALSAKGARGLWQLMPDTARRYGLIVDAELDERLDIRKSTRAAARYLRDQLVQKAIDRVGDDDNKQPRFLL